MTDLPPPLTPVDCDLQDFPFMPLHVARLRDSDLAAEAHPEACWYAVLLWSASWHQLPAGSLPDNDAVLMRLIGLGRDAKTFKKHRADALRGWILCSDGRLYHPVVAEQVLAGWDGKLRQRHRTLCAAIRKHNERKPDEKRDSPTYDAWLSLECPGDMAAYVTAMSRVTDPKVTRETPSKRERQGEGQGDSIEDVVVERASAADDIVIPVAEPDVPEFAKDVIGLTNEVCRAAGIRHIDPGAILRHVALVKGWIDEGFDPDETIMPAVREAVAKATERINALQFFDRSIRQFHARKEANSNGFAPHAADAGPTNSMVRAIAARRAKRAAGGGDDDQLRISHGD